MDPRLARTREAALNAAAELLADGGLPQLTYQNVSRAAGVGRTTLYRHWPTTPDLVLDLLQTFRMPSFEWIDGDLNARLLHNVELQRSKLLDPEYSAVYRTIQSVALDQRVRNALVTINKERVQSVVMVLKPDYDLTGRSADVTDIFALINGPFIQMTTFTGSSSERLTNAVVQSVLAYLKETTTSPDAGGTAQERR